MYYEEVELFLNNIKSVISSKIITDSNDEICEIHVLSDNSRHSKQISRDIRTALLSQFNINVDYKIISIAQIDKNISFNSNFRLQYEGYSSEITSDRIRITTKFSWEDKELTGQAEDIKSDKRTLAVAANSTLNAIRSLIESDCFVVEDIQTAVINGEDAILVAITYIENGKEEILVGSSLVENNKIDGAIKATLNAINRKICLLIKE